MVGSRRMPAQSLRALWMGSLAVAMLIGAVTTASAQPPRLTVERLRALPSTANDPAGDAFTGTPAALNAVLDALAADSSLVGPMQLFLASNTALRLARVEDAAFFFYAAQVRAAFDFERFDVSARADGNNAATYLGFLRHTIGEQVNPRDHARAGDVRRRRRPPRTLGGRALARRVLPGVREGCGQAAAQPLGRLRRRDQGEVPHDVRPAHTDAPERSRVLSKRSSPSRT